ncbi:hypothetical protein LJY25_13275 [Hymenobacter sp. BT175]|uniref:hypothetical protein n=1 Tax=Hymenobacter translucens TaxID=2886507 RepID=UPI001D0F3A86|nr:hypothetical protein [Hymenobacter translucens]MCC2547421.1 hypothetical protein [Hymenobacter translucens]
MNRFLFPAFLAAALLTSSFSQAQSKKAPVLRDADGWPIEAPAAQAQPEQAAPATLSGWETAVAAEQKPSYNTGWMSAPGMSLSVHHKPSTDWWGRPLKKKAAKNTTATVAAVSTPEAEDPMMRSSGVMAAPGMNTAPYRAASTDYQGRPLRKASKGESTLGSQVNQSMPVASVATASE